MSSHMTPVQHLHISPHREGGGQMLPAGVGMKVDSPSSLWSFQRTGWWRLLGAENRKRLSGFHWTASFDFVNDQIQESAWKGNSSTWDSEEFSPWPYNQTKLQLSWWNTERRPRRPAGSRHLVFTHLISWYVIIHLHQSHAAVKSVFPHSGNPVTISWFLSVM